MSVANRIQQFIDNKGISKRKFDENISQSDGYIGKQIRNNASIGSDVLEKICALYPELSPSWLLTGEGEMILGDKEALINQVSEMQLALDTSRKELKSQSQLIDNSLEVIEIRNQRIAELEREVEALKAE